MPPGAILIGKEMHEEELGQLIENWVREKQLLRPGQVVNVKVEIMTPLIVTVGIDNYQGVVDVDLIQLNALAFTVRTMNCLNNTPHKTVGDIRKTTLEAVLKHRNFGKKSAREISDTFREKLQIDLMWRF